MFSFNASVKRYIKQNGTKSGKPIPFRYMIEKFVLQILFKTQFLFDLCCNVSA